jgi:hypothetical protein
VAQAYFGWPWIGRAVKLVVSPLWFLARYLMLIALLPVALWLHRRCGVLVLIWLAGAAMCVDILRFKQDLQLLAWLNMVLVWGWRTRPASSTREVVDAARQFDWALLWAACSDSWGWSRRASTPPRWSAYRATGSPTAPPIRDRGAALFQISTVELLRPTMERLLTRPRWRTANRTVNRFALPLFLFHSTGMAIALVLFRLLRLSSVGERPTDLSWSWWLMRPLALIGPLLFTLPVIALFGRRWVRAGEPTAIGAGAD